MSLEEKRNPKITNETKQKIKQFNNMLNTFANLKDQDEVNWYFDPNTMEEIENRFGTKRIRFKCYDPEFDHDFTWDAPFGAARQVVTLMQKGVYFLHVERHGSDTDTRYVVRPISPSLEE